MKNFKLTLAGLFGAAVALSAAAGNPASKNVIDAAYRPLPSDWWNLVKTEPRCGTRTFVRDEAKWPHTQISLAADRAFREQVMRPMTDERGALGIDSWESWHQTQYKMKFAELAKLCRPETLEAAKAAAKKK